MKNRLTGQYVDPGYNKGFTAGYNAASEISLEYSFVLDETGEMTDFRQGYVDGWNTYLDQKETENQPMTIGDAQ